MFQNNFSDDHLILAMLKSISDNKEFLGKKGIDILEVFTIIFQSLHLTIVLQN